MGRQKSGGSLSLLIFFAVVTLPGCLALLGVGDPCALSNCDGLASCVVTGPSTFICACMSGYTGEGSVGNCQDLNECVENLHNCSTGAECTNLISPPMGPAQTFTCACADGFVGDGFDCTELQPTIVTGREVRGLRQIPSSFSTAFTEGSTSPVSLTEVHRATINPEASVICALNTTLVSKNNYTLDEFDRIFPTKVPASSLQFQLVSRTEVQFLNNTPAETINIQDWVNALSSMEYQTVADEPSLAEREVIFSVIDCTGGTIGQSATVPISISRMNDHPPRLVLRLAPCL